MSTPDRLVFYRKKLEQGTEFLCGFCDTPEGQKALAAVLYVASALKLDAEEMSRTAEQSDLLRSRLRNARDILKDAGHLYADELDRQFPWLIGGHEMTTQAEYDAATAALREVASEAIAARVPELFRGQANDALEELLPAGARAAVDAAAKARGE